MSSIYTELRNLVSENKLKDAIKELKELVTENGMINTVITVSANYHELQNAINNNTLEWNEKIFKNRESFRLY